MNGWTLAGPNLTWDDVTSMQKSGKKVPLYICGHACIGDHIICAGMYRVLSQIWKTIIVTRPGQHNTVCLLMQGIEDAETVEIQENYLKWYAEALLAYLHIFHLFL